MICLEGLRMAPVSLPPIGRSAVFWGHLSPCHLWEDDLAKIVFLLFKYDRYCSILFRNFPHSCNFLIVHCYNLNFVFDLTLDLNY